MYPLQVKHETAFAFGEDLLKLIDLRLIVYDNFHLLLLIDILLTENFVVWILKD